jgi:hypothetical protein
LRAGFHTKLAADTFIRVNDSGSGLFINVNCFGRASIQTFRAAALSTGIALDAVTFFDIIRYSRTGQAGTDYSFVA